MPTARLISWSLSKYAKDLGKLGSGPVRLIATSLIEAGISPFFDGIEGQEAQANSLWGLRSGP